MTSPVSLIAIALLDAVAPRLTTTLDHVGHKADRLDRVGATFESRTLAPLLGTGFTLGRSIRKFLELLRRATAVGGAVGSAVLAGVRALFSRTDVSPIK